MEQKCKSHIDNSDPPDNHFSEINSDLSEASTDGLVPLAVPVRRVFLRTLAKIRLRQVGIIATDGAAAILTRTTGRGRR